MRRSHRPSMEYDLQRPEPIRSLLARLYKSWDEYVLFLRRLASERKINIRQHLAVARAEFDKIRCGIIYDGKVRDFNPPEPPRFQIVVEGNQCFIVQQPPPTPPTAS